MMIAQSLGSFFHFEHLLSHRVRQHLQQIYQDFDLQRLSPRVYPALQDLPALVDQALMNRYRLVQEMECRESILVGEEVVGFS